MILFNEFTLLFDDLAFAKLLMGRHHLLQVHIQHSPRHSCYLEFAHALVSLEIDFNVLCEIKLRLLPLFVDKSKVEKYRFVRQKTVMFALEVQD